MTTKSSRWLRACWLAGVTLWVGGTLLAGVPAAAAVDSAAEGPLAQPLAALQACRAVPSAKSRLECFDRAAGALETATLRASAVAPGVVLPDAATPGAPAAAAPLTPAPPPARLNPQQQFGLPERAVVAKEVAAGTRAADVTKIASRVSGLGQGASGLAIFTLENGQVWRQLSTADVVVARVGDLATVSRGAFSSFWLELNSGRGCKVSRVL